MGSGKDSRSSGSEFMRDRPSPHQGGITAPMKSRRPLSNCVGHSSFKEILMDLPVGDIFYVSSTPSSSEKKAVLSLSAASNSFPSFWSSKGAVTFSRPLFLLLFICFFNLSWGDLVPTAKLNETFSRKSLFWSLGWPQYPTNSFGR